MVKCLCAGLALAGLVSAADAADLSMTPIYKSRPSAASSLDGRLKAEYGSFDLISPSLLDRPLMGTVAATVPRQRGPINSRPVQTGLDARH